MSNRIITIVVLALVTLCPLVMADPVLHWAPSDTLINNGDQVRLSVMLDEAVDVRTIELSIEFDPDVVLTIDGGPGTLFDGFNNFAGFEEQEPGRWYGYCVILGASDWTTGPGELFHVTVEGTVAGGTSPLSTVSIVLLPPGGGEYPETVLTDDQIRVLDVTQADNTTPDLPDLTIYPNPFNPRTTIRMTLPPNSSGRLEVLDLRGRVVATPWQGRVDSNTLSVDWDGNDTRGQAMPSGVYTFRMVGDRGPAVNRRGVLIR